MSFFKFLSKNKKKSENQEEKKADKTLEGTKSTKSKTIAPINNLNMSLIYNPQDEYRPISDSDYDSIKMKEKFNKLFEKDNINLDKLKKLAWNGIPHGYRSLAWKILLSYVPPSISFVSSTLQRKRAEYSNLINLFFPSKSYSNFEESQLKILKIIQADVPRTQPELKVFHLKEVEEIMVRVLFTWNLKHPASGYVQGINDLIVPFISVFLNSYLEADSAFLDQKQIQKLTKDKFEEVEADTYWCLCKILDYILDNYTQSQPGIQKALMKIKEICFSIDKELVEHLEKEGVEFTQFAFKWVYCLLIREFPLKLGLSLFDVYISINNEGFMGFHIYVCASLILKWSAKIKKMWFGDIMGFLQNLPTKNWNENDIRLLVSEAYSYQSIFGVKNN